MHGHGCMKSLFLSERKLLMQFKSKAQVHERCSFSWNEMLLAIADNRFSCVWAFLQRKVMLELQCTRSLVRAYKNTNAVFSATKQMKRIHGHGCWKAYFSVRESCLMQFKSKAQVHERCFFSMNEMLFAIQKTDFHMCLSFFAKQVMFRASCT